MSDVGYTCQLAINDLRQRGEEIRQLSPALRRRAVEGTTATLEFSASRLVDVRNLVAAESECCSFFTFAVTEAADTVRLDVTVPADGLPMLHTFVDAFGGAAEPGPGCACC